MNITKKIGLLMRLFYLSWQLIHEAMMAIFHKVSRVPQHSRCQPVGFSLVELLAAITILGLLATIALAALGGGLHSSAREAVHRRNAQELTTLSWVAQANGANPVVDGDVEATVIRLIDGVSATSQDGKPLIYRTQFPRSGPTFDGAVYYLSVNNGMLSYKANKPPQAD